MLEKDIIIKEREVLERVGFVLDEKQRSGSFILLDTEEVASNYSQGVTLYSMGKAVEKIKGVKEKLWTLVSEEKDRWTKMASSQPPRGYFIHVAKGVKVEKPLQACFFIATSRLTQTTHNLIVLEDGAELHIINGCATASYVNMGLHVGITEIFVGKGAFLSYTMIHDWAEQVEVRPRTGVYVDQGGKFISNYITIKKSKITQSYPEAIVEKGGTAQFASLVYAPENSIYDLGARIYLNGQGASGEIISRAISGGGKVFSRGHLVGNAPKIKAHMSCDGLLLNQQGSIVAIPELEANHPDVEMSHEAAVGRIAEEEIEYLMSRGFSPEQAKSLIIKGFLDPGILGLPPALEKEVNRTIEMIGEGGL